MLYESEGSSIQRATNELVAGALFFGMRSCEYSYVPRAQKRVTKLLQLEDLHFYNANKELLDQQDQRLEGHAHTMTIMFQNQKNRHQMQVIPVSKLKNKSCPIKIWSKIVKRMWSYIDTSHKTTISTVKITRRPGTFVRTKLDIETRLKTIIKFIGETKLGIKVNCMGCHSIRATLATILQLTEEKETNIQQGGLWRSHCYKGYMRNNILNGDNMISTNISNKTTGNFFTFQTTASTTQNSTMGLHETLH